MKGLLLRLSAVDSDAEAAVRVIAYFDELVAHRASLPDLVRSAAALAECPAGLHRPGEPMLRFRPDGSAPGDAVPGPVHRAGEDGKTGPAGRDDAAEVRTAGADRSAAADGAGAVVVAADGATAVKRAGGAGAAGLGAVADGAGAVVGGAAADGAAAVDRAGGADGAGAVGRSAAADGGGAVGRAAVADGATAVDRAGGADGGGAVGLAAAADGAVPADLAVAAGRAAAGAGVGTASRTAGAGRTAAPPRTAAAAQDVADAARAAGPGAVEPGPLVLVSAVEPGGRVWLERAAPEPLDDLVLERFAIAARLLARPGAVAAPHLADPALVELVLGERAAAEDRARALVLLGLAAGKPVRVVAVGTGDGRDPGAAAVALMARGGAFPAARVAVVGEVAAVVVQPREGTDAVVSALRSALADRARERSATGTVRVGVGDPVDGLEARRSWLQARLAERFAGPGAEPVIVHEELGSRTLLAEIPPERLRAQPDVRALDELAATPAGAADVATLEAFCRTGSLRQAAVLLHRHHSSVAGRLAHVEDALGWRLDDPGDRFRAHLALLARRLAARG